MSKRSKIVYILENLHFLLDSGLPMTGCLDVLARRNNFPEIVKIKEGIIQGKTFSESMTLAFGTKIPYMMNMFIRIGELCGNLGQMIMKAVETDKQIKKINSSFLEAVSYPLFICVVAFVMMLMIMIGIVPKLLPMFRDLHVELPIYTRFFIATSNIIVSWGVYVIFALFVLVFSFLYFFKKFQEMRTWIEVLIFNIWGFKSLYVRYHTAIIALCISEYLRAGYALHDALKMVGDSVRSFAYKETCHIISIDLQHGKTISEAILSHKKIMPDWSHVLDFASQTGRLADQFERFYLENVSYLEKTNRYIKRWSEPLLMLFIGGVIAIFAVSIISPIYSIVQNVRI